jgi:phosphate starvation-inducible PhoH-like protein
MSEVRITADVEVLDTQVLVALAGPGNEHLKMLERTLGVASGVRGNVIRLSGDAEKVALAERFLAEAAQLLRNGNALDAQDYARGVQALRDDPSSSLREMFEDVVLISARRRPITAKGMAQKRYIQAIRTHDLTFGIGPAGTGKTYLAMAMAVHALLERRVKRIILARPAVEAGERLGFLPGDLAEKVNPYLRPLYDALHDMMDVDKAQGLVQRGQIEVAPLAFMRGRAQPLSSRVLTPLGWRPIGELRVGDEVIGSDGRAKEVLGVYPQGRRDLYRVTANDGAATLCCGEHLWSVFTPEDRNRRGKPRTLETREMLGQLRRAHQHRYELPVLCGPVRFAERPVPLEPYALGLLLGDGCLTGTTTPAFATADRELVDALQASLRALQIEVVHKDRVDYVLRHTAGGRGGLRIANPVTVALRGLGLCGTRSGTKFVPEVYLQNAAHVRLAVLQGLLDTDGGPVAQEGRSCRVQYTTTSPRLRDDVLFLVRSLGGVAHCRTRFAEGRTPGRALGRPVEHRSDAYLIDIRLPREAEPFRLARKAQRYRAEGAGRPMRFITSIEPAGSDETVCIRVAAADALYVTDDFLLTHNTLNDCFVILDEAQNATSEQMRMFLTRLGYSSRSVVTGDVTQVDLPQGQRSGLAEARKLLSDIEGIAFCQFTEVDVVRHPLVQRIIVAYDRRDADIAAQKAERPADAQRQDDAAPPGRAAQPPKPPRAGE